MSDGLEKKYKIYFPEASSSAWLGGVNYFKNLFLANYMYEKSSLDFYIQEGNPEILFKYAKKVKKKNFEYKVLKFLNSLCFKKIDKEELACRVLSKKFNAFSHCLSLRPHKNLISWIPDFQHIYLPEMFSDEEYKIREENFKKLAVESKIVILSSFDALSDFQKKYPDYAEKGRVLNFVSYISPEIYEKTESDEKEIKEKFNLPEKYFFLPNQFWKHKNHITAFRAILELKKQGIEAKLLCSGYTKDYRHKEHFENLTNYLRENNLEDNVKFLGVIDLNEVYFLMRNCVSIINPSLFEGWSSTVEEAKSLGKNIILSDLNVHREQNPKGGVYFERDNYVQLASIMKQKLEDGKFGPDFDLEKEARENMDKRMIDFAKKYEEIVLDTFKD